MSSPITSIINNLTVSYLSFKNIRVEKCTYINRTEEKTEIIPIWKESCAFAICGGSEFRITIQDNIIDAEVPFATFYTTHPFSYCKKPWGEMALVNGNSIQMRMPLVVPLAIDDDCQISFFSIIYKNGMLDFCLLLNPSQTDDYYYRIMLLDSEFE